MRCLKDAGPCSVWLIERPGEAQSTLKTWPLTIPTAMKLLVGSAQPQRQLRGSRLLRRLDLRTPEPVGGCVIRRRGGRWQATVEFRYVPGRSIFEMVADGRIDERMARAAGPQIGRAVRILADAGLIHRDLKLNNLIVEQTSGGPVVWFIDAVGIRPARNRVRRVMRMLDRLFLQAMSKPVTRNRWAWAPLLHEALRGLSASDRREAFARLRRDFRWRDPDPHPEKGGSNRHGAACTALRTGAG